MSASRTSHDRHRKLLVHRSYGESARCSIAVRARRMNHFQNADRRPLSRRSLPVRRHGDFCLRSNSSYDRAAAEPTTIS